MFAIRTRFIVMINCFFRILTCDCRFHSQPDWIPEMPWMSLYFSFAVWSSIWMAQAVRACVRVCVCVCVCVCAYFEFRMIIVAFCSHAITLIGWAGHCSCVHAPRLQHITGFQSGPNITSAISTPSPPVREKSA